MSPDFDSFQISYFISCNDKLKVGIDDFTLKMMTAALMQIEFFNIRYAADIFQRHMADDKALSFL